MTQIYFDSKTLKNFSDKELLKRFIKLENQYYSQKYHNITQNILEQYQYLLEIYEKEMEERESNGVNFQDIEEELEEEGNEEFNKSVG